ncbi:MAG: macro domain-containing protein [Xanthomonadaceae bacterium]|nr:macro domain-containing protein [Xanthomonadaceae bacterium]
MIHEVSGDILKSRAQAIAHGVAPNDDFHTGLALSLREHAPALYKDFRHFCQSTHPKSGGLWTWAGADGRRIVNLFTQDGAEGHHGGKPGKATLSNVRHAMKALRAEIDAQKIASIALPRLATGVGGLDWADVRPVVYEHLADAGIPVYVYTTFHAGMAADEPA